MGGWGWSRQHDNPRHRVWSAECIQWQSASAGWHAHDAIPREQPLPSPKWTGSWAIRDGVDGLPKLFCLGPFLLSKVLGEPVRQMWGPLTAWAPLIGRPRGTARLPRLVRHSSHHNPFLSDAPFLNGGKVSKPSRAQRPQHSTSWFETLCCASNEKKLTIYAGSGQTCKCVHAAEHRLSENSTCLTYDAVRRTWSARPGFPPAGRRLNRGPSAIPDTPPAPFVADGTIPEVPDGASAALTALTAP